jgi:tetratricopeptide (TPR) repeat protein
MPAFGGLLAKRVNVGLTLAMDLAPLRALVLDPRRTGSAEHRAEYRDELRARYAEIGAAMDRLVAERSWDHLDAGTVDARLELSAAVVFEVGELIGDYDQTRAWGDRLIELGRAGSDLRRSELMFRVSELHRVTGHAETWATLVHQGAELMSVRELSPDQVDALAPLSCHALFCLGSVAAHEDRTDEARELLSHAWVHGGDSDDHLWSLLIFAAVESGEGRHESALPLVESAVEMADRLGDTRSLQAARNNLACTLRWLGRHEQAFAVYETLLPEMLGEDQPDTVLTGAEDFACVLLALRRDRDGAVLLGAVDAEREAEGVPRIAMQEAEVAAISGEARDRLGDATWYSSCARGAELGVLAAAAAALRSA